MDIDTFNYFSSKDSAEKWIEKNKSIFSKKQINDAINKSFKYEGYEHTYMSLQEFKMNIGI
jgi:hypothetical protein